MTIQKYCPVNDLVQSVVKIFAILSWNETKLLVLQLDYFSTKNFKRPNRHSISLECMHRMCTYRINESLSDLKEQRMKAVTYNKFHREEDEIEIFYFKYQNQDMVTNGMTIVK